MHRVFWQPIWYNSTQSLTANFIHLLHTTIAEIVALFVCLILQEATMYMHFKADVLFIFLKKALFILAATKNKDNKEVLVTQLFCHH